jgi:secreted PhoX family phosphatase
VYGKTLPELKCLTSEEGSKEAFLSFGEYLHDSDQIDLARPPAEAKALAAAAREIAIASLSEVGVSIVHVRQKPNGAIEVVRDSADHKRISFAEKSNISSRAALSMTGAVKQIIPAPVGTACNCSGGVTPWGTVLTCEENYQDIVVEEVGSDGLPDYRVPVHFSGETGTAQRGLPIAWMGISEALTHPPDPRTLGWVCEVFPETGALLKHSALGRFRHENVTIRARSGEPLAAYMGDDRRGGHVWKYVSSATIANPRDLANSRLLETGTLFVARFRGDFTGDWIPLTPDTPLSTPEPQHCATGHMLLPGRPDGGFTSVGSPTCKMPHMSVSAYVTSIEDFTGKSFSTVTLGDLIRVPKSFRGDPTLYKQGAILIDAFVMANAVGGTPSARPEDLEVDERDGSIFVAFTDSTGRREGSPDTRVFPDSHEESSRQYGAIYRLVEFENGPQARRFTWSKVVAAGEVAEGGSGLACADNLLFDGHGDLWVVCDISTEVVNKSVDRLGKAAPGKKGFLGVFGNSSMFRFRREEGGFGFPEAFAMGPVECEITGPTFTPDGRALLLSIQHPGELYGCRGFVPGEPTEEARTFDLLDGEGEVRRQERTVPLGSNFPFGVKGRAPRPTVVCIRKQSS